MRKTIRLLLILLAVGACVAGGLWLYFRQGHETTDNAYVQGDITVISPKVVGYVTELLIEDNQAVTAGQILMRIDARDYQARVDDAEAALEAAEAALKGFDQRIEAQKAALSEADAGIMVSDADLSYSNKELSRVSSLLSNDVASRKGLDVAATAQSKAAAGLAQAQAKRDSVHWQLAVIEADRAQQKAAVEQAKAKLALARIDLANTEIRAPADGVIGNRNVQNGQLVTVGTRMFSLISLHSVWVDANYKETQIGAFLPGQRAVIKVDAFPGIEIEGHVASVAPASGSEFSLLPPQNATGNFTKIVQRIPVRIELAESHPLKGRLRLGMSVVVDINTRTPES